MKLRISLYLIGWLAGWSLLAGEGASSRSHDMSGISGEVRRLGSDLFEEREAAAGCLKALLGRLEAEGKKDDLADAVKALARADVQESAETQGRVESLLAPYRAGALLAELPPQDFSGKLISDMAVCPGGVLVVGSSWSRFFGCAFGGSSAAIQDLPSGMLTCCLSPDGKTACVARQSMAVRPDRSATVWFGAYDVPSGRKRWDVGVEEGKFDLAGEAFVAGGRSRLSASDAATGKARWQKETPGTVLALAQAGGTILAGGSAAEGGWLACHDAVTGETRWERTDLDDLSVHSLALADGAIFAGGEQIRTGESWLGRFDLANGQTVWSVESKTREGLQGGVLHMTVAEGRVTVSGGRKGTGMKVMEVGWLASFDARTGKQIWKVDLPSLPFSPHRLQPEELLAFGREGLKQEAWIRAWSPADGTLLWERKVGPLPAIPLMMDAGPEGFFVGGSLRNPQSGEHFPWLRQYRLRDVR